jgi:ketosteroid isomerase-like protein
MAIVERWDAALRRGDWATARSLLADDATYHAPEADPEYRIECESADEIVKLMRDFKGQLPDIEVVQWAEHGDHVLARLRQPEWGTDSDWFKVLTVRDDRIARMVDYSTEGSALTAVGAPAA